MLLDAPLLCCAPRGSGDGGERLPRAMEAAADGGTTVGDTAQPRWVFQSIKVPSFSWNG